MSEAKFTPGPWIFRKCSAYGISISAKDGESIIGAMECQNTAFLEICDEDAHLIAAAPELYEALEAVISYGAMTGADWVSDKVYAALAKARGETV